MANEPVNCKIEHHAILFAYLAKRAIEICGEEGKEAILAGMTTYGNERASEWQPMRWHMATSLTR